jgi:hypothetical protein
MPTNYTLTYSSTPAIPSQGGWPSFYSYFPEQIQGMNQYLYTFDKGNLYRHNTNLTRNQYYDEALIDITPSSITTAIIGNPLAPKIFKTIELDSDTAWSASLESDIQSARTISALWFEKKEGNWFAFVRGLTESGETNFSMRSANGIGICTAVDASIIAETVITFDFGIGSIIQQGDTVFYTPPPVPPYVPTLAGDINVGGITVGAATSTIIVDCTGNTPPAIDDFIFYQKNQIAESHGLLGHYCKITLSNDTTVATELFSIVSDVMKSYP